MWNRLSGENIENFERSLRNDILKYQDEHELKFFTGCDSQVHKGKTIKYITVVVLYRVGKGGLVYFTKHIEKFNKLNPKIRLWNEVLKAVETAMMVDKILVDYNCLVEEVHADLNYDKKYLSSEIVSQCLGYIKAMGYNGVLKPDAWASSKVADKFTKNIKNANRTKEKLKKAANKKHKR